MLLTLFVSPLCIQAKPILTVTCDEPTGTRYDQVHGKITQQPDGFAGIKPAFIVDDVKAKYVTVIWGDAKWARDAGIPSSNAEDALVLSIDDGRITAVIVDEYGAAKMYSLYPTKGLIYFSQHKYMNVMDGVPVSSSFYANCTFSEK